MKHSMLVIQLNVRKANPPNELLSHLTKNQREFLHDYADFNVKALLDSKFQLFLNKIAIREGIELSLVPDVRIMLLPPKKQLGQQYILHGTFNTTDKTVSIYPELFQLEKLDKFRNIKWERFTNDREVISYLTNSIRETLIHELLHMKYDLRYADKTTVEIRVRELAKKYANEFKS